MKNQISMEFKFFANHNLFSIVCKGSGLALRLENSQKPNNSKIIPSDIDVKDTKQLWFIALIDNQYQYQIINAFSNYVLTLQQQFLVLEQQKQKEQQRFSVSKINNSQNQFIIKYYKDTNKAIYLSGILLYGELENQSENHVFEFKKVQNHYLIKQSNLIKNTYCLKYMNVLHSSKDQGASIIQYKLNGRFNQRWNIEPSNYKNFYYLQSSHSKLYLSVKDAVCGHYSKIIQLKKKDNNQDNQLWEFKKIKDKVDVYQIITKLCENSAKQDKLCIGIYHNGVQSNQLALTRTYEQSSDWHLEGNFKQILNKLIQQ